ncbi:hypothetical protein, partial [Pectobacterium odoriferum]|uniref:hypothetical protein n=1 Tax=Pectobacterium odoriferum TaxID=78398 RepID=UPI001CF2729B
RMRYHLLCRLSPLYRPLQCLNHNLSVQSVTQAQDVVSQLSLTDLKTRWALNQGQINPFQPHCAKRPSQPHSNFRDRYGSIVIFQKG